jgi:hypothetical protein
MDECLRERFLVIDGFLPEKQGLGMREDIDAHFSNPSNHQASTHQVWNYWHVPGSYTYLRTTPEKVIDRAKVQAFVEALGNWAALNLGLAGITWPYLSLYVPGCVQGLHNDSTNGRLGYVYSLTRNARQTIGGETVLMHDRDLFRSSLDRPAAGTGLYDLVEPRFNRLTLFDDRIPHAVQRVDGSMDPMEGRFVLHGHISEAGVVTRGPLPPEDIQAAVDKALEEVLSGVAPNVHGPLVLQLEIARSGEIQRLRPIFDRLASADSENLDYLRGEITEPVGAIRFPVASSPTLANVPLIF